VIQDQAPDYQRQSQGEAQVEALAREERAQEDGQRCLEIENDAALPGLHASVAIGHQGLCQEGRNAYADEEEDPDRPSVGIGAAVSSWNEGEQRQAEEAGAQVEHEGIVGLSRASDEIDGDAGEDGAAYRYQIAG
jgi:hypothetical protein